MIGKIERGEAQPTAVLLGRLSGALGMTLSELVARAEEGTGDLLRRAADQPVWTDPATGYRRRAVSPVTDSPLELVEVELPPGASVSYPADAYIFKTSNSGSSTGHLRFHEGPSSTTYPPATASNSALRRPPPSKTPVRRPAATWSRWSKAAAEPVLPNQRASAVRKRLPLTRTVVSAAHATYPSGLISKAIGEVSAPVTTSTRSVAGSSGSEGRILGAGRSAAAAQFGSVRPAERHRSSGPAPSGRPADARPRRTGCRRRTSGRRGAGCSRDSARSSVKSCRRAVTSLPGAIKADWAWVCITTRSPTGRRSAS